MVSAIIQYFDTSSINATISGIMQDFYKFFEKMMLNIQTFGSVKRLYLLDIVYWPDN